jgi:hypothetical protein
MAAQTLSVIAVRVAVAQAPLADQVEAQTVATVALAHRLALPERQ